MKRLVICIILFVTGFMSASYAHEADKRITLNVQVNWTGKPEVNLPLLFSGVLRVYLSVPPSCFVEIQQGVFQCKMTHTYSSATPSSESTDLAIKYPFGSNQPSCTLANIVKGDYTADVILIGRNPPSSPGTMACNLSEE